MPSFTIELKSLRKNLNLTPAQAAERIGISEQQYQDVEGGAVDASFAERLGFLVGLGLDVVQAKEIIHRPGSLGLSDILERGDRRPFVIVEKGEYIFNDRSMPDYEYAFGTDRVQSPLDVMTWINHLSEKCWIQKEHLTEFISLAATELRLRPQALSL